MPSGLSNAGDGGEPVADGDERAARLAEQTNSRLEQEARQVAENAAREIQAATLGSVQDYRQKFPALGQELERFLAGVERRAFRIAQIALRDAETDELLWVDSSDRGFRERFAQAAADAADSGIDAGIRTPRRNPPGRGTTPDSGPVAT